MMPRYRIRFDDNAPDTLEDCPSDAAATEYAMELLLDNGAEPGEEATVYRLPDHPRGYGEHVATVIVPGDDA
jgi:hypothetical protein